MDEILYQNAISDTIRRQRNILKCRHIFWQNLVGCSNLVELVFGHASIAIQVQALELNLIPFCGVVNTCRVTWDMFSKLAHRKAHLYTYYS